MTRLARSTPRGGRAGFTLLEVLVALVILAIALAAAVRAAGMTLDSGIALKQRVLAGWVAENRMAELAALQSWPDVGASSGSAEQGGAAFEWQMSVAGTPNPSFRRVEIRVYAAGAPSHALAQLVGYATAPPRP